jgi:DNA modification methylase
MKPVELIRRCLANSSAPGDVVLDPFAGSGSTLIACHLLGRRGFAMEVDPIYCDVILRRLERVGGFGAQRISASEGSGSRGGRQTGDATDLDVG